jgi:diguanylate cyclase (GGDEF)-like protein
MVIFDIDRFKRINDKFGHGVGDLVINEIADLLDAFAKRFGGHAARVGGEEFRVFVPIEAKRLVPEIKALQKAFSQNLARPERRGVNPIKSWNGWTAPTFSVGISGRNGKKTKRSLANILSALATESDAALYTAKKKRNDVKTH